MKFAVLAVAVFILLSSGSALAQSVRVFVASGSYTGDLGGIAGADIKCMLAASVLGGKWNAWLSDGSTSPSVRLYHNSVPYVLVDGTAIAENWEGLTDGELLHAIDLTENQEPPDSESVWTGTRNDGTSHPQDCNDWTEDSHSPEGRIGKNNDAKKWTNDGNERCDGSATIYCFEQKPVATAVESVEGDHTFSYVDVTDNGKTVIVVAGENGMTCKWYGSDVDYSDSSGIPCITSGARATCTVSSTAIGNVYTKHIACKNSLGNGQSATENLDVTWEVNVEEIPEFVSTAENFTATYPDAITATVGQLTDIKIDIYNIGTASESYILSYAASFPGILDITNRQVTTQTADPGQSIPVHTSIRTLTGDNNALSITITGVSTGEILYISIPVRSGKFSLPEFGIFGFLQIILISSVLYFLYIRFR